MESGNYSIAVKMSIKFDRGSEIQGLKVRLSNEMDAIPVQFSDEQMRDKYPLDYESLTNECRKRYSDFLSNQKYHDIRQPLKADSKYCHLRLLNPKKPNSAKQEWYSRAVLTVLDQHYTRKRPVLAKSAPAA